VLELAEHRGVGNWVAGAQFAVGGDASEAAGEWHYESGLREYSMLSIWQSVVESFADGQQQQQITRSKTDDGAPATNGDTLAVTAPKCSCRNASLCKPLPHGPPSHDIHAYSDGGGPCLNETAGSRRCTRETGWELFDLDVVTTLVMMHGHPITVDVNGAVTVADPSTWPLSELVCSAHAHDTRVLITVLADKGKGPTGHSDPTGRYYQSLLGNATAVQRMGDELTALVGAAGLDGVEFVSDFHPSPSVRS
jgi:hypothetical protein